MNFKDENIELFDRYIQHELTVDEQSEFEQRISSNTEFNAEFEEFKAFEASLKNVEVSQFKDKLKEWDTDKQVPIKKESPILPMRLLFMIAAVALIGFFTVNYFYLSPSNQAMVASNFTPYDNIVTIRGAKEDIDDALLLYEQTKYKDALTIFNSYPTNATAVFYGAESSLAIQDYTQAIKAYQMVILEGGLFYEVATYHLGLAFLGADKKEESIAVFETIPAESDYYSLAQDLLGDLK